MNLQVGHVVKLKVHYLNNDAGAIGLVVQCYILGERMNYMVIFENGNICDGFSEEDEVDKFLDVLGVCEPYTTYHFENVIKLSNDYSRGYFDVVLKEKRGWL